MLSSSSHKTFHAASARPPTRCSSILLIPYSCTFPSETVEQNADENRKKLDTLLNIYFQSSYEIRFDKTASNTFFGRNAEDRCAVFL